MMTRRWIVAAAAGALPAVILAVPQESQPERAKTPAERQKEQQNQPGQAQPKQPNQPKQADQKNYDNKVRIPEGQVNKFTQDWPQQPKEASRLLITKYGLPHDGSESFLIWRDTGPFHKTVLMNEEIEHQFPVGHSDFLLQCVYYKVPVDKFDELAQFDGSIYADRTAGLLSAKCDKEENNYLLLNLAHEIITGKRSVNDARQFAADTLKKAQSGEKPEIMTKLMFQPQTRTAAADPDRPVNERAEAEPPRPQLPSGSTTGGG